MLVPELIPVPYSRWIGVYSLDSTTLGFTEMLRLSIGRYLVLTKLPHGRWRYGVYCRRPVDVLCLQQRRQHGDRDETGDTIVCPCVEGRRGSGAYSL